MENMDFYLNTPSKVIFGWGKAQSLLPELVKGIDRLLILTGKTFGSSQEFARLKDSLLKEGKEILHIAGVQPEPPLTEVERLLAAGREFRAESLIAIGGGSILDAGKTVAALFTAEGSVEEYFYGKREVTGKGIPCIALPTTSGTGAEITSNAVLTDEKTQIKKSLRAPGMTPAVALCDPELTVSCPPALTAHSGLDAFVQAFESCTSAKSSPYSKALAYEALKLIVKYLPSACKNGKDKEARTAMAEASLLTAMAFTTTGLGAIHGLAHPIGSLLHVPHGLACALLIEEILKWNISCCNEYGKMAKILSWGDSGEDFLREAVKFADSFQIGKGFGKLGLKREDFPFIIANCRSASMKGNPRHLSDSDVEMILEHLL